MNRIAILIFLLTFTALSFPAASRQALADDSFRILVVVNGIPVTNHDFEERLGTALVVINSQLQQQGRPPLTLEQLKKEKEVTDRILEQFIEEILLQQEIKRYGLSVPDAEIDARINVILEQRKLTMDEMTDILAEEGASMEVFRGQLRDDLLKHQLIRGKVGKKIVVTETEVLDRYKKQASIQSGVLVHLAYILLPEDKDAAEVAEEIADGNKTFAEAADAYSVGPGMGEGGDLGWLDMGDLAQDWRDAVMDLEAGGVSKPFDVGGQKGIIMLVERKQGEVVVDEKFKEQIYEELREEKFQQVLEDYMTTIRTQALIQYKNSY